MYLHAKKVKKRKRKRGVLVRLKHSITKEPHPNQNKVAENMRGIEQ